MRKIFIFIIIITFSCTKDSKTIKVKGSDTEVNLAVQLAEEFHKIDKDLLVSISGGGSGLGIAALLNGTADIANSSRNINAKELSLFKQKNIKISSFIFAQDAIAFVVSEKLPLDSISTESLHNILNGEWDNWAVLIGKSIPINIYGRQSNSGTYDYIRKTLHIHFSPYAKQMNGNAQILEALKVDSSGIGYVGAGYVMNKNNNGIKILKIFSEDKKRAISLLDVKEISNGNYFFQRPLYQFYKSQDYQKVKPFLDFEQSQVGLSLIKASGYYPVKSEQYENK